MPGDIDLDYRKHYTSDGKWILDLNKAYNPWVPIVKIMPALLLTGKLASGTNICR